MALRSVVLEPPAAPGAPRRTVVLRAGGPQPSGKKRDLAVGVLGVLLLLFAVVLVQVLPDTDYVLPRYKVTYPAGGGELEGGSPPPVQFVEGSAVEHDFLVVIPDDNVISVKVSVSFEDDLEASHPDSFRVRLYDPTGAQIGQPQAIANPPPVENQSVENSGHFDAFIATATWTFALGGIPQEQIVEAAHKDETQRDALVRLEPVTHVATNGTWTVKVELINAGDCPMVTDPGLDDRALRQIAACTNQQDNPATATQTDVGNPFRLENVAWSYYVTCTETLEVRDPKPLPSCM